MGLAAAVATFGTWPLELTRAWSPGETIAPELIPYLLASGVFAGFFGLGGFWALWRGRYPAAWASLSAIGPVAFLIIVYARVHGFEQDIYWSSLALMLGLIGVIATGRVERTTRLAQHDFATGIFAAATVTAFSLAFTMALSEAWLTVALAAELPVLAWLANSRSIKALRPIAGAVALVVIARLLPNIYLLDYASAGALGVPWVIYGYGWPALAFFMARAIFLTGPAPARQWISPDFSVAGFKLGDWLTAILETGAIAFAVVLVNFLIRIFMEGRIDALSYGFTEAALQQIAWASAAALLWSVNRRPQLLIPAGAWRLLLALASAHLVLVTLIAVNPLWNKIAVGAYPLVNLLFLAYGGGGGFCLPVRRDLASGTKADAPRGV